MTGRYLVQRIRSLKHAIHGIALMVRTQHNARIHLAATLVVLGAGLAFGLTRLEWLWIVVAVMAVWTAEGFNTALELLADAAAPGSRPLVGRAKDVAAGAVLIAAVAAAVIGMLVFGPYVARAVL